MKTLATFAYVVSCLFLLGSLGRTKLMDTLPTKKRVVAFLSCFILPAIYLAPYYFEIVPAKLNLPGWIDWLPFFLMAVAAAVIHLFYPQKEKEAGVLLAKIVIGLLLLYNFLPFAAGIIQRW
jgi:hypothetical protein